MNEALQLPGVSNAWTMPIKARIDMLTTGVRTPVGIKIYGADIADIERDRHARSKSLLPSVDGTRSVFAERTGGGYFLDFDWKREELARYGLSIDEAQTAVMSAIGGENVTTTVEGRERYPVNVRYMRDFRSDLRRAIGRVLVPAMDGSADSALAAGRLCRITVRAVHAARRKRPADRLRVRRCGRARHRQLRGRGQEQSSADKLQLPAGLLALPGAASTKRWSACASASPLVLPLTLFLILLLLYLNTRSVAKTMIIVLAVPFSAVGAIWFLYLLGYNMSIGVWVGLIALMGVDAETGVFMLLYLDLAYDEASDEGRLRSLADLQTAILHGAVKRIRPKFMTVAVHVHGPGADHVVHRRGRRRDEAHRRADDRRHLHFVPAGVGGLSRNL